MTSSHSGTYFVAGSVSLFFLLVGSAWFHVQATRWGYRLENARQRLEEMEKKEQRVDQRLQTSLALDRLDQLAKNRFDLKVPNASQIILIHDVPS